MLSAVAALLPLHAALLPLHSKLVPLSRSPPRSTVINQINYVPQAEALVQLSDRETLGRIGTLVKHAQHMRTVPGPILLQALWKPLDIAAMVCLALSSQFVKDCWCDTKKAADSKWGALANVLSIALSNAAGVLAALYAVDGVSFIIANQVPALALRAARLAELACVIATGLGIGRVARALKAWLLKILAPEAAKRRASGTASHFERLTDATIWGIVIALSLEVVSLEFGIALKTILALGGFSGVVVGLAFKAPAADLVSGLMIDVNGAFSQGDTIECAGVSGVVERFGWFTTCVRGADGASTFVPNSAFAGKPLRNLSTKTSTA